MRITRLLAVTFLTVTGLSLACRQTPEQTPDVVSTAASDIGEVTAAPELLPNQTVPAEGIVSGGQPTPQQLAAARDAGYRTVINLRQPDEPGVGDEAEIVGTLGMEYVSIPVAGAAGLTRENVETFATALEKAEYPVVLHCSSGNRIGALMALKAAWLDGKTPEEAMQIGLASGLTRLEGTVRKMLEAETNTG
jgi:uncharacterized protein (TIGR01244 family)